ncbi:MAG: cytochrome c oxidase assembly protein [Methylocystis sp.]|jgi:cytochrome c oxidase assembly protein subunit 11
MTGPSHPTQGKSPRAIAAALIVGSIGMLGLSFASVPLYRAFCAATGFGGTPQVGKAAPTQQGERRLAVLFDANVSRELPWRFEPETAKISLRTGEMATVYYKVANLSDQETSGQAAYNVSPEQAGAFFVKVACFCFDEQRLGPRETAEWPVVFYLDPALEKDEAMRRVEEITLSYSFYPTRASSKTSAAVGQKPKS